MNHEAEVKKVYPDAYCIKIMTVFFVKDDEYGNMSKLSHSQSDAWQSAYETLKKQGKITT